MGDHLDILLEFAKTLRASRRARRWSQQRLAHELGVSAGHVSRLEHAQVPDLSLRLAAHALEAVGGHVDIRFIGEAAPGPPQRDRAHARCVAYVAGRLERAGWQVVTEVEAEAGGGRWRSFIDVLAFRPFDHLVLVIEIKTEIHDVGAIDRQIGMGERGAWDAARRHGWRPRAVLAALLILWTEENDRRVIENGRYLDTRFAIRPKEFQRCVDAEFEATGSSLGAAVERRRAVAMIDPRSRRRQWLIPTRQDGRRSTARYRDRIGYLTAGTGSIQSAR